MSFRNIIGTTALANVQNFLTRFQTPELIEAYIKAGLFYYGEIPFLYRVFKPTDVPSLKEKGKYKVVSNPPFTLLLTWGSAPDLLARHVMGCSRPNPSSTPCSSILEHAGSRIVSQWLFHQEKPPLEPLLLSALLYVLD